MLSVIVPVYNVAPYLRHCLQSLSEQGVDDYEVILVNDASRDNSRGICSEWCADHSQFRLLNHAQNMGLSEARNTGLREARGEWVTFVDSDDYLEPMTLSQVLEEACNDVDVVEYPVMEKHLSAHPHELSFSTMNLSFRDWLQQGGHRHCYACNKVFRKHLWEDESFCPGRYYEDIMTIPKVLRKARAIRQTDKGLYYYCERSQSICTGQSPASLHDYVEAYRQLLDMPESEGNYDLYLRAYNGELTYKKVTGEKGKMITHRRIPLRFALSRGLTFHDRLKILWIATTIHG